MHNLRLITIREYLAKVRNKSFITMTFLSPVIMVAMFLLIIYLANLNVSKVSKVAMLDESGLFKEEFQSNHKVNYIDYSDFTKSQAIDSSKANDFTGMLYIPDFSGKDYPDDKIEFYTNSSPNTDLISIIEQKLSGLITEKKMSDDNIDLAKIEAAQTDISVELENFEGEQTSKMSNYVKMAFGGGAGYLLFMFILIYGNMVMRSVIEEKTSRIVEIIISSVKPIQLMWGKILGTTMAGLTQFLIWLVLGGLLLIIAGSFLSIDFTALPSSPAQLEDTDASLQMVQEIILDIANLPLFQLIVYFIIYFIGGYFLYSAIYAAIGAAVDNETDTQQFIFPITIPLMLGIYVGFFSVIGDPHGTVATVFSHIPFTSPVVMLMRIPFGVAWWEVLISIGLLFMSIFLFAWIGSKIYRVGILMYGKKPSYKDMAKWLKY